jgi:hypothetical protein
LDRFVARTRIDESNVTIIRRDAERRQRHGYAGIVFSGLVAGARDRQRVILYNQA